MLFKPCRKRFVDEAFHDRAHFRGNKLVLGLRREFRVRNLDGKHSGQAFAAIIAGKLHLFLLGHTGSVRIARYLTGQRTTETGQMGAAIALRNVIGEAKHLFMVGIIPPHGDFNGHAVFFALDIDRCFQKRLLTLVDIFYELDDATVIVEFLFANIGMTTIGKLDTDA
ncbi:hypothetical protein D3C80_252530 [compost metagenome]